MEKSIVALVPCEDYDEEKVYRAVQKGLELIGGIEQFVSKEEKILLKPNLLTNALPQKAVTTHPAVFGAVARLLRENGYAHLFYGDSPSSLTVSAEKVAQTCGLQAPAEQYGVTFADFNRGSSVRFEKGKTCRSFCLANGVQQADALINLCKMKTHALERITGAVKNLYGCIYSANKATGHARYPNAFVFADMLSDLLDCVHPRLHIMDGIQAMEGNGPNSGTPIAMHVLLFSNDPVALDSVFASLIDVPPQSVPTCESAARHGLGKIKESEITVRTPQGEMTMPEAASQYGNPDFDVFRGDITKGFIKKFMGLLPFLQDRPQVDASKCVACGICEKACPVPEKAVHSGAGRKAKYDYKKCIRCYCCQEMCPAKAITVHHSKLNHLLRKK